MVSFADFLKIPKTDSFNDLLSGMRYSSYANWAGFKIPGFSDDEECNNPKLFDDFKFYNDIKINGKKDLQNLFYMSVSEAAVDNVKALYAGIDLSLCGKCDSPAEFIAAINEVKTKTEKTLDLYPILSINSDIKNNLFLAETFIDSKSFSGIVLSGEKFLTADSETQIYEKIFSSARKLNLKTEINALKIDNPEKIYSALATFKPDFLKDISESSFNDKILDFIKQTEICVEFTPYVSSSALQEKLSKYKFMKKLFDSGIKIHLCTGSLLFLKKSISEFAADLCGSGIFSMNEAEKIMN